MTKTVHGYFCEPNCVNCTPHQIPVSIFLDNEFDIVYISQCMVHVQKQLRHEMGRQNVFPEISHGMSSKLKLKKHFHILNAGIENRASRYCKCSRNSVTAKSFGFSFCDRIIILTPFSKSSRLNSSPKTCFFCELIRSVF